MTKKPDKTAQFLEAMRKGGPKDDVVAPPPSPAPARATVHEIPEAAQPLQAKPSTRAGLKHFGAYLDEETLEKIALLRVRLKLDNSALTKLAIDDLHRKHMAKRAFGDS